MNLSTEDRALMRLALDAAAMSLPNMAPQFAALHDRIPAYPLPRPDITAEASAEMRREAVAESEAARDRPDEVQLLACRIADRLCRQGYLGSQVVYMAGCVIEGELRDRAAEVGR